MGVGIIHVCGIKSRNRNIIIQGKSRAHTTSLTPSHFIEASVPNPESKQSLYVVYWYRC